VLVLRARARPRRRPFFGSFGQTPAICSLLRASLLYLIANRLHPKPGRRTKDEARSTKHEHEQDEEEAERDGEDCFRQTQRDGWGESLTSSHRFPNRLPNKKDASLQSSDAEA
jgi:hypothetical protein